MFSKRIGWSLETNAYSRLLRAKRQAGCHILDLTESNPTRAGLTYPGGIVESLAAPGALLYEPNPWGLLSARQAVAKLHGVAAESVMLTASTSESYGYLFKLLCDPGDRVLVPQPSYPLFEFLAKMEGVEIDPYLLRYDGQWRMDFDSIRAALTPRTRAILLVNPNNPTCSYVSQEEINKLGEFGLPVVSDEVFHPYVLEGEEPRPDWSAVTSRTLLFRLSGLSKLAGLPQMKAGWILLDGPGEAMPELRERLELIADTYLSVSSPVQHALPELLRLGAEVQEQIRTRTRANLTWLQERAAPLRASAGWYAILCLPEHIEEYEFVLTLLELDDVLVQPGFFYDFPDSGWVVLSLLTPEADFREGVTRLLRRVPLSSWKR